LLLKKVLLRYVKKSKQDGLIPENGQSWQNLLRKIIAKNGCFANNDADDDNELSEVCKLSKNGYGKYVYSFNN
jgi:hypothetical protein